LLRWLLLIPFALIIAMGAGTVALMILSVSSPEMAMLLGAGFGQLVDALFGMIDEGLDVQPTALAAVSLLSRLGLAIIVIPVASVAIGSELFRMRSGLVQSGLSGLLAAVLPLALLGLSRAPSGPEMRVIGALYLVGAASGFVYWLIAGRDAGGERRAEEE
jgi:hypothetical protein